MTTCSLRATGRLRAPGLTLLGVLGVALSAMLALVLALPSAAGAAQGPVDLGTAASYSVLAGSTVTNTGPSRLGGDLGLSPGTATPGFPPGQVDGAQHSADAQAGQAQNDMVTAFNDASGRATTMDVAGDLVGRTLTAGVYTSSGPLGVSGAVTLDAQGDPGSVFVFQVASTLITASASRVIMLNGAQACNVWWQVGSSATLGTGSSFIGTIMASTSVTVNTNVSVEGRAMAHTGAVTLDTDVFTTPGCERDTGGPESPTESSTAPGTTVPTGGSAGATSPNGPVIRVPTARTTPTGSTTRDRDIATTTGTAGSGTGSGTATRTGTVGTSTTSTGPSRDSTTTSIKRLSDTGSPLLKPLSILSPILLVLGGLLLLAGRRRSRARHH